MGLDSNMELRVRAFNAEAKKRVQDIDLSEYNLIGWTDTRKLLICKDSGLAAGRNDFDVLMEKIAEALNGKGMAYLCEAVDEDVPYATTYYYLGNRIRKKRFRSDYEAMMDEEGEYMDPGDVADELYETYIPTEAWAKEERLTDEETALLKKYPW